jgi:hypothetical protein
MGQTHSGKLVLISEGPVPLDDAFSIFDIGLALQVTELDGRPAKVRSLDLVAAAPAVEMPGPAVATMTATFLAKEVVIESNPHESGNPLRFYLTNVRLARSIVWSDQAYNYRLSRVPDYEELVRYRQASGETGLTACFTVDSAHGHRIDVQAAEKTAANICSLLSFASGSTVAWVMREDVAHGGVSVCHRTPKVSASQGMEIISPTYDLEYYVVSSLPVYEAQHNAWNLSWAIRLFTDAVNQSDYLEMRTLKLVTLMEHIAGCYTREFDQGQFLIPPEKFNAVKADLRARVKKVLKDVLPELSAADRKDISLHVSEFSRRTFDHTLKRMARHLKLDTTEDEWERFVKIRNHVVHQARFLAQEEGGVPWDQYRLVLSIVTRVMLAILKYDGYYYDWARHIPGELSGEDMCGRVSMRYA